MPMPRAPGFNAQIPAEKVLDDINLDVRPIQGVCGIRLNLLIDQMLKEAPEERPTAGEVLQRLSVIHKEICEADFTATGMMR
jgi:hypothetical protein